MLWRIASLTRSFLHVRRIMSVAARLGSVKFIPVQEYMLYLGYRDNYDHGEYHLVVGGGLSAPNRYAIHAQGESGCQCPICMACLGLPHGGSSERVDDEQQLLMRWGSTSVALSQPASSAPPIKFCTKNISWIDGIWSPSPAHMSSLNVNPPLSST